MDLIKELFNKDKQILAAVSLWMTYSAVLAYPVYLILPCDLMVFTPQYLSLVVSALPFPHLDIIDKNGRSWPSQFLFHIFVLFFALLTDVTGNKCEI